MAATRTTSAASRRVIACGVAAVLAGWGLLGLDLWRHHERDVAEAERQTRNLVSVLEDHTARTIQAVDQALAAIADGQEVDFLDHGERARAEANLTDRLALLPQLRALLILDSEGKVLATSLPRRFAPDSMGDREFFRDLRDAKPGAGLHISGLVRAQSSGRWVLGMSRRINGPNGEFRGVVHGAVDPAFFAELYQTIDLGAHSNVTLFDRDGDIIARWPKHEAFIGRSIAASRLFREFLPNAAAGTVRLVTMLDPRDILLSYRTVAGRALVINVAADMRDVLARWRASLPSYGVAALGIAVLVSLIVVLLLRQLRREDALREANERAVLAVTERELSERNEGRLRGILDSMFAYVGLFTTDGTVVEANRAPLAAAGLRREDVIGRPFWETYWWSYSPSAQTQVREALRRAANGEQVREDFIVRIADDRLITIDATFGPLQGQDGEVPLIIGSGVDISDRVRIEAALRANEARLNNAQRIAALGNWDWDVTTNALEWSDQIFRIFGLEPRQFGASYPAFLERVHPDDRTPVEEAVRRAVADGAPYDIDHRIVRPDGAVRIVHEQGEVIRDDAGRPLRMTGIVQDVTELREAEAARHAMETRLIGILGIAPEAIIVVDGRGHIQMFNVGAERIFGHAAADVMGRPLDVLIPERFRTHHRSLMQAFGEGPETSRLMAERGKIVGLRSDGSEFPAEASIAKLVVGDERLFTVILRDVTDRVAAERALVAAKDEAERASRTKSEFLANVSHELRTPLNAIIGFSDIIRRELLGASGVPKYVEYADEINASGQHLLTLINDILELSRIGAGEVRLDDDEVDVDALARACVDELAPHAARGQVTVTCDIRPALSRLVADGAKLKQVLSNLLSNAVKFTPAGGRVAVTADRPDDAWFEIVVADTGIGMAEADIPRAFLPFTQLDAALNRKYEGTGLGLPLARSLTELHGGVLILDSAPGQGTRARVRLPASRLRPASDDGRCVRPADGVSEISGVA
jgi:PAS domain S-box-containing protein